MVIMKINMASHSEGGARAGGGGGQRQKVGFGVRLYAKYFSGRGLRPCQSDLGYSRKTRAIYSSRVD